MKLVPLDFGAEKRDIEIYAPLGSGRRHVRGGLQEERVNERSDFTYTGDQNGN